MAIALRTAALADVTALLPRMRAFNAAEHIAISEPAHEAAVRRLLATPELGEIWVIEDAGAIVGYAVVTYGFDLEYAGHDAWLTEIWIDPPARGRGAAEAALDQIATALAAREVRALHLMVRLDNPAVRLYERARFEHSPRLVMTRSLT